MKLQDIEKVPIGSLVFEDIENGEWSLYQKMGINDWMTVDSYTDRHVGSVCQDNRLMYEDITDITNDFKEINTVSNISKSECHCSFKGLGHDLGCEYIKAKTQYSCAHIAFGVNMEKDYKSIHFQHDVTIYVPCYQKNPKNENDGYPTFTYNLAEASSDEQLAASFEPDYILKLTGKFDAKTKPFKKDAI